VGRPRPERRALLEGAIGFMYSRLFTEIQPTVPTSPPPSEPSPDVDEAPISPPQQQSTSHDDDEEVASVKVLPAVTLQIWGSLLNRRGYQVSGTELVRTTSAPAVFYTRADSPAVGPEKSVISAFRRANSFMAAKIDESGGVAGGSQPFRRTTTSTDIFVKPGTPLPTIQNAESSASVEEPVAGPSKISMFAGYKFSALGEAKSQNVKHAIESYGGLMVHTPDEEVDFIIVRLVRYAPNFRLPRPR
jgi:DNA replication regulator DPB11